MTQKLKRYTCTDKSLPYGPHGEPTMPEHKHGAYVLYSDVEPLIKECDLLCNEIARLLRKIHGEKEHPKYEISIWTFEYNKLRSKIKDALASVGVE